MMLRAQYDAEELAAYRAARAAGKNPAKSPRTTHVQVLHTGASADQNFDDQMIDEGKLEGWAEISGDVLTLKTDGEPLRYMLLRGPGYFCRSSGQQIPVSEKAWYRFRYASDSSLSRPEALAWLEKNGKDASDYDISVTYQCVLDDKQHQHFRAVRNKDGVLVAAHQLQEA